MILSLSDDAKQQSIESIKRYFQEELEQDIGVLKATLFFEFIMKEIAPSIHNGAINGAQKYLQASVADLDGACTVPEFAFWPGPVRKKAK